MGEDTLCAGSPGSCLGACCGTSSLCGSRVWYVAFAKKQHRGFAQAELVSRPTGAACSMKAWSGTALN